jgi:hypothetical protein
LTVEFSITAETAMTPTRRARLEVPVNEIGR